MNRFLRRFLTAMLLGVAVYGFFVFYAGYQSIRESLAAFEVSAFVLALALASGNYLIRFLKWQYYLKKLGIKKIPVFESLLVFLSGFVLTITPGKIGEVFKSAVLAKTHDVPALRTAPIVVAERLTDAIGVIVLIVVGGAAYSGGVAWAIAGSLAVASGMLLIIWQKPGDLLLEFLNRRSARMSQLVPKLRESLKSLRVVAGPSAVVWPTLLSIVAWGLEGVALFVTLRGFQGVHVPLGNATFFYSTATLAGALVPVPGGLGIAEAMIQEQLVRLGGVPQGAATASMILIRFATLWWAVIVGFMALMILRFKFPEQLKSPRDEADSLDAPLP